jgi:DNA polymerase-3 subunit delta
VADLTLVVGDEEFLVARAVREVVAADADVQNVPAGELRAGELAGLLSPSLFGGPRAVVVEALQDGDKTLAKDFAGAAQLAGDGVQLVATHSGSSRGRALAEALRSAGAEVVDCPRVRWPEERQRFVQGEVARAGGEISSAAAEELLAAVGTDLRELSNVCRQLVGDTPGGVVDEAAVARYRRGRAEATGFAVADRAVEGDAAGALELLRWGLAAGLSPVLVTSALASNLRTLAAVAGAGRAMPAQVANELGLPVWKVRKAQSWVHGWHPDRLAAAVQTVATADAAVKGAAADPAAALEGALLAVAAARHGG